MAATPASPAVPSCTLDLKVVPNAPRNEFAGWLGDTLKVKVHAPALEGRANAELTGYLAAQLRVPHRHVTLLRGEKSRLKTVRIATLTLAEVKTRLAR